jgi:hypothetical protein
MNGLQYENYRIVYEIFLEDLHEKANAFVWEQWLAYYNAWLLMPSDKKHPRPRLLSYGEFLARAESQRKAFNTSWEQAEEAGKKAYERLRKRGD